MILKTAIRRQKSLNERNAAKPKSINYTEPEPPVLKQLTLTKWSNTIFEFI
jgi:hypothetical protein